MPILNVQLVTKNRLLFQELLFSVFLVWVISPSALGEKGIVIVGQYAWSPAEDAMSEPYEAIERHEVFSTIWGANHTHRDVETAKIVAVIQYVFPEDFPTLTADSASLITAIKDLENSVRKFPRSQKWLEPKIAALRKEAELYRLGSRKFGGRWHSPEEIALSQARDAQIEIEDKRQAAEKMKISEDTQKRFAEDRQRQIREATEHAQVEMKRLKTEAEVQNQIKTAEAPLPVSTTKAAETAPVSSSRVEPRTELSSPSSHGGVKVMVSLTMLGFIALAVASIRNSNTKKPKTKNQPNNPTHPQGRATNKTTPLSRPRRATSNTSPPPPPKRPTNNSTPPPPPKRSTQAKDGTPGQNKTYDAKRQHSPPSATPLAKDERYYGQVLGLSGKITPTDIKRCYRELVVKYHPDKVQHLGDEFRDMAEQKTKEINEAYSFFQQLYGF